MFCKCFILHVTTVLVPSVVYFLYISVLVYFCAYYIYFCPVNSSLCLSRYQVALSVK